ncbi:phage antirepressor KilAC domain-containing protein [Microbacterium sp.]|uniref:phage antirepressor KilAC domain-containing protein n=1 Tax=Microbacterium sp. TaxID=51671 RepID=UPI0037CC6BE7
MSAVVELAQPRKLLSRWHGHGDLLIVIDGAYTYLRADDVEHLAGIPRWSTGDTVLGDEWPLDVAGVAFYLLDDAFRRCEQHGTLMAREFTAWLLEFLARVDDTVLEEAHQPVPFTNAHTVTQAARALAESLRITLGRDQLFEQLDRLDWIGRNTPDDDWVITPFAHTRDLLTLRPVNVPASNRERRRRYLQIHVTPRGLDELRRLLAPAVPPPPPLF